MLLLAIDRIKTLKIFDRTPYESGREAMPGSRLLTVLVFSQRLKGPSQRGIGRAGAALLQMVSYQLTDGKLMRVLTSRHDLRALLVAQLYTERWTIENWWQWLKRKAQEA